MSKEQLNDWYKYSDTNMILAEYEGWKNVFEPMKDGDTRNTNQYKLGERRILFSAFNSTLKYHCSFDSLLPVVNKVMDELFTFRYRKNSRNASLIMGDIERCLKTCFRNITPLYESTVKAIEFINSLKK